MRVLYKYKISNKVTIHNDAIQMNLELYKIIRIVIQNIHK